MKPRVVAAMLTHPLTERGGLMLMLSFSLSAAGIVTGPAIAAVGDDARPVSCAVRVGGVEFDGAEKTPGYVVPFKAPCGTASRIVTVQLVPAAKRESQVVAEIE
jgi:hypothetical protein